MKKLLLVALVALMACSRSVPTGRSAGETLVEYYAACTSADTARTYALSTRARVDNLEANASEYFARCYRYRDTIHVLKEIPTADSISEVLYTDVVYDRATGARMDSVLGECTMIKENGQWKVSQCHNPVDAS